MTSSTLVQSHRGNGGVAVTVIFNLKTTARAVCILLLTVKERLNVRTPPFHLPTRHIVHFDGFCQLFVLKLLVERETIAGAGENKKNCAEIECLAMVCIHVRFFCTESGEFFIVRCSGAMHERKDCVGTEWTGTYV